MRAAGVNTERTRVRRQNTAALISILLAVLSSTGNAAAEEKNPDLPVPIIVDGTRPGLKLELERDHRVIASCITPCAARVLPGSYWLVLAEDDEPIRVPTRIRSAARLTLVPPDPTTAGAGLAVGIGGTVAAVVGVGFLLASVLETMGPVCEPGCSRLASWVLPVGLGSLVVGAVATPIGWTMYGKNRKTSVVSSPLEPKDSDPATSPIVGLAALPGGAVLLGSVVF